VAAVRARIGPLAEVRVDDLQVRGEPDGPFVAVPAPGLRLGVPGRFVLRAQGSGSARVGEADAVVTVSAPHLRAARPIRRGDTVVDGLIVEETGDLGKIVLAGLPPRDVVAGAIAMRDVAAGEPFIAAAVATSRLVKPGDRVVVRLVAGSVRLEATLVAAQGGGLGDVIRCVNPETRKATAVRIVAPGVAEVVHAF
jgi:flagella basal body P-ring formation protein FlgA